MALAGGFAKGKLVSLMEPMVLIQYMNITDNNVILNMIVIYFPPLGAHFSIQSSVCHMAGICPG